MPGWVLPVGRNMIGGLDTTLVLSVSSALAGTVLGIVLGALATLPSRPLTSAIRAYVELWRGLPIIITLFFIFFTLPAVGIRLDPLVAALIGLVLWTSANTTEVVRGAVRSIPVGQHQAAAALGLSWAQAMRYVILPQALRRMLPPLVSLIANLIQSTALAAIISVPELTLTAQRQIQRLTILGDSHAFEILGAVLVVYFLLCLPLTRAAAALERRLVV